MISSSSSSSSPPVSSALSAAQDATKSIESSIAALSSLNVDFQKHSSSSSSPPSSSSSSSSSPPLPSSLPLHDAQKLKELLFSVNKSVHSASSASIITISPNDFCHSFQAYRQKKMRNDDEKMQFIRRFHRFQIHSFHVGNTFSSSSSLHSSSFLFPSARSVGQRRMADLPTEISARATVSESKNNKKNKNNSNGENDEDQENDDSAIGRCRRIRRDLIPYGASGCEFFSYVINTDEHNGFTLSMEKIFDVSHAVKLGYCKMIKNERGEIVLVEGEGRGEGKGKKRGRGEGEEEEQEEESDQDNDLDEEEEKEDKDNDDDNENGNNKSNLSKSPKKSKPNPPPSSSSSVSSTILHSVIQLDKHRWEKFRAIHLHFQKEKEEMMKKMKKGAGKGEEKEKEKEKEQGGGRRKGK